MTPRGLLVGALSFSLAFQVAWALFVTPAPANRVEWFAYILSVLAAVACTLIVPAGLHVWPMIEAPAWWQRWVRNIVMTGVCGTAAVTTFLHSVHVLIAMQWENLAAGAVVGGVELLVVLSTMALRPAQTAGQTGSQTGGQPTADSPDSPPTDSLSDSTDSPEQSEPQTVGQLADSLSALSADSPEQPRPTPEQSGPRRLSAVPTDRVTELSEPFLTWAAGQPDRPSNYAVRQRFRCGRDVAADLLALLDRDEAAS